MWISGQWNNFGITETPEDGRLRPKHVVRGKCDKGSCILDGIILCIKIIQQIQAQATQIVSFSSFTLSDQ
jgi:hypothetical protein